MCLQSLATPQDDREIGTSALYHTADLDGIEDHRTREQGHAKAATAFDLLQDLPAIIAVTCAVDNTRFEAVVPQRAGQTQQAELSCPNFSGIRRKEEHDFAGVAIITTRPLGLSQVSGPAIPPDSCLLNLFLPRNEIDTCCESIVTGVLRRRNFVSRAMRVTHSWLWRSAWSPRGSCRLFDDTHDRHEVGEPLPGPA
jgi:hypothetical protein